MQSEEADSYMSSSNGRFLLTVLGKAIVATRLLCSFGDSGALLREVKPARECPRSSRRGHNGLRRSAKTFAARAPCAISTVKPAVGAEGKSVSKVALAILSGCGGLDRRVAATQGFGRICGFAQTAGDLNSAGRSADLQESSNNASSDGREARDMTKTLKTPNPRAGAKNATNEFAY